MKPQTPRPHLTGGPSSALLRAGIEVRRLRPRMPAMAACFSLPVPPGAGPCGVSGMTSQGVPIAWWNPEMLDRLGRDFASPDASGSDAPPPRRLLMTLADDTNLPETAELKAREAAHDAWDGPIESIRVVERCARGSNFWEVGELALRHGDRETAVRLGLKMESGQVLWWEWLRVETVWSGPACRAIRCAGYIPTLDQKRAKDPNVERPDPSQPSLEFLHQDRWFFGEVYALLFRNGVIHLTVRHVNNHLYHRHGHDVEGLLPVCGIRGVLAKDMPLAGEAVDIDLGSARLNTEECRTLSSPDSPGRLEPADGLVLLQPYGRMTIPLHGICQSAGNAGDIAGPEGRIFPRGVTRTFRFCLSLGAAPARVERYVLPHWWYGMLAELEPQPLLPVYDELDGAIADGARFLIGHQYTGTFNDGSVRRYHRVTEESGWEGETAYNLFRHFHRDPAPEFWDGALRCVYNLADIAVDHVGFLMRMHGYDSYAIAPTMNRGNGLLLGYLETGDPYLRETCENLAMAASSLDVSNWPRRAYGRDALYIRGLILLEDYLPGRGHGARAREALGRLAPCQTPEGCVTNQSGGAGVHATGNVVITPWQNFHVLEPVMDWLERHPEDGEMAAFFQKACRWLASVFVPAGDGGHWPDYVRYGDNERHPANGQSLPCGAFTFPLYAAKSMLMAAMRFNDPAYLRIWQRCLRWLRSEGLLPDPMARVPVAPACPEGGFAKNDHAANKACESLAWHQRHRWNAQWVDGKMTYCPYVLPGETLSGTVLTPAGPRSVSANGSACRDVE